MRCFKGLLWFSTLRDYRQNGVAAPRENLATDSVPAELEERGHYHGKGCIGKTIDWCWHTLSRARYKRVAMISGL